MRARIESGATQAAMAALKLTPSARSFRLGIDHLDFTVSFTLSPQLCIGSCTALPMQMPWNQQFGLLQPGLLACKKQCVKGELPLRAWLETAAFGMVFLTGVWDQTSGAEFGNKAQ